MEDKYEASKMVISEKDERIFELKPDSILDGIFHWYPGLEGYGLLSAVLKKPIHLYLDQVTSCYVCEKKNSKKYYIHLKGKFRNVLCANELPKEMARLDVVPASHKVANGNFSITLTHFFVKCSVTSIFVKACLAIGILSFFLRKIFLIIMTPQQRGDILVFLNGTLTTPGLSSVIAPCVGILCPIVYFFLNLKKDCEKYFRVLALLESTLFIVLGFTELVYRGYLAPWVAFLLLFGLATVPEIFFKSTRSHQDI